MSSSFFCPQIALGLILSPKNDLDSQLFRNFRNPWTRDQSATLQNDSANQLERSWAGGLMFNFSSSSWQHRTVSPQPWTLPSEAFMEPCGASVPGPGGVGPGRGCCCGPGLGQGRGRRDPPGAETPPAPSSSFPATARPRGALSLSPSLPLSPFLSLSLSLSPSRPAPPLPPPGGPTALGPGSPARFLAWGPLAGRTE